MEKPFLPPHFLFHSPNPHSSCTHLWKTWTGCDKNRKTEVGTRAKGRKPLPGISSSSIRAPIKVQATPLLLLWRAIDDNPGVWVPVTHMGVLDGVPVSWIQPRLVLAIESIRNEPKCRKSLSLSSYNWKDYNIKFSNKSNIEESYGLDWKKKGFNNWDSN